MKSTWCQIDGEGIDIYKDPKTVVGMPKKSLKGLIQVVVDGENNYIAYDQVDKVAEESGCLSEVFCDGKLINSCTLDGIRKLREAELEYD